MSRQEPFFVRRWPTDSRAVSQYFGGQKERYARDLGLGHGHNGLDIDTPAGRLVYAVADGQVRVANTDAVGEPYGLYVSVAHAGQWETRYAHLQLVLVRVGETVKTGQPIGAVGCTGSCKKPHLHFEVRHRGAPVDPWPLLRRLPLHARVPDGYLYLPAISVAREAGEDDPDPDDEDEGLVLLDRPDHYGRKLAYLPRGTRVEVVGPPVAGFVPVRVVSWP